MRIIARSRYHFLIRVVCLQDAPDVLEILVPRAQIVDSGPTTYREVLHEWYWNMLCLMHL